MRGNEKRGVGTLASKGAVVTTYSRTKDWWLKAGAALLCIVAGALVGAYWVGGDGGLERHVVEIRQPANDKIVMPSEAKTTGKTNRAMPTREVRLGGSGDANKANPIATLGEWGIFRNLDTMTDKAECSAAYYNQDTNLFFQPFLRLNYDKSSYAIFFFIDDYAQSYRIRFNDDKATEWFDVIPLLGKKGIVQIFGENYQKSLESYRMRVEVTGLRTSKIFDVKTDNIGDAVVYMLEEPHCR